MSVAAGILPTYLIFPYHHYFPFLWNANNSRHQCTCSPPSPSHPKPSKPRKRKTSNQMSFTPSCSSMLQAYVLSLDLGLGRRRVRITSERPSWRPAPSGLGGLLSSTKNSWRSLDERRWDEVGEGVLRETG